MKLVQRPAKIIQTPAEALQTLLDKYQITAKTLSRHLRISYMTISDILQGKVRITAWIAIYLAKYFRTTPKYWLKLQMLYELNKLETDQVFISFLGTLPRAKKPKTVNTTKGENTKTK
ncbi:MAG: HigA family addiction module antitoxin [Treponema sp.]|nr:HigA family addiction module antitoxin [Treponema sp.]